MTKVLIHVPIFNNYSQFWESLWNLNTDRLEIDYFFTKTNKVETDLDDKGNYKVKDIIVNLPYKMEKARKTVLAGDYDYLFNVEDDHILPRNALKEMLKWKKDAISGVYRLRPSKHPQTPIAATLLETKKWVQLEDLSRGPLLQIDLIAWGCLLLSRRVLEVTDFDGALDGQYKLRLDRAGVERWLATEVKVGHIDRDGKVIWP